MAPSNALQIEIQNLWNRINKVSGTLGEFNELHDNLGNSNSELTAINQDLSGRLGNLASDMEALQAEYSAATEKINSLELLSGANSQLLAELRKYELELSQLRIHHEGLKIDYNNSLNKADELANQVDNMSREMLKLSELEDEKVGFLNKIKQLETQCADFEFSRQEIVRKNKDIFDKNNEIRFLRDRVSELDSKMFELNRLRDEFHQSKENELRHLEIIQELNAQISGLQAQLEIAKKKIEDRTTEHNLELELIRKDFVDLRNKYHDLDKSKQEIVNVQLGLVRDIEKYQSEISDKDEKIEGLISQISELTDTAEQYFNEIERLLTANDLIKVLQQENLEQSNKIQELEADFADVQAVRDIISVKDSVIEQLNLDIASANQTIETIQNDFRIQLENIKSEYNLLSEKNEAQHKQIAELMTAKSELSVQFKAISQYNSAYKESIKIFEEKNLQYEKSKLYIADLENQIIELEDKIEQVNISVDAKNRELADNETLIETYKKETEDKSEQIKLLNLNISSIENELNTKAELIIELEQSISNITQQRNEMFEQLNDKEAILKEIESVLEDNKNSIELKDEQLSQLNRQIDKLKENIEDLEGKETLAQLEVLELNDELRTIKNNETELQEKINLLNDKNLRLIEAAEKGEVLRKELLELESNYNNILNERNALRNQNNEQNEQITVLLAENTELSDKIDNLSNNYTQFSSTKEIELTGVNSKYEQLAEEAAQKDILIQELSAKMSILERDNAKLITQLEEISSSKADQDLLIDIYTQDANTLEAKLSDLELSYKELQTTNNENLDKIISLHSKSNEYETEINNLKEELRNNNTKIEEMVLEHEILEENIESMIESSEAKAQELVKINSEITTLTDEINTLKFINNSFDSEIKQQDEKITNLNKEKAELKLQLSDVIGAKTLLENQLSDANNSIAELSKANSELNNSKSFLENKIADSTAEISRLNSENLNKILRIEQAESTINELNNSIAAITIELNALKVANEDTSASQTAISQLLEDKSEYELQISELNSELVRLNTQLAVNEDERNKFDIYYSELKSKYQEVNADKEKYEKEGLILKRETDSLSEQIASLESQLSTLIESANSKDKQINALNSELELHKELERSKDIIKSELIDTIESYIESVS